jgi:hypothetical protein
VQLPPHLPGAIDPEVVVVDPADLDLQLLIATPAGRRRPAAGVVVGGRGDRQDHADRLDPEPVPVGVDVGDHLLGRRSSSLMLLCQAACGVDAGTGSAWRCSSASSTR